MQLSNFLEQSRATDEFCSAVADFLATRKANPRIRFEATSPDVKVERMLAKLLAEYPQLAIEWVEIRATSGCEFFRGTATVGVDGDERRIRFHWDCRWKAEQMGWTDCFGFPDQARAAREFGYDCFRGWEEEALEAVR